MDAERKPSNLFKVCKCGVFIIYPSFQLTLKYKNNWTSRERKANNGDGSHLVVPCSEFLVPYYLVISASCFLVLYEVRQLRCCAPRPSTVAAGGRVNGPPASPVRDHPRHRVPKEPAGEDEMSWPRFPCCISAPSLWKHVKRVSWFTCFSCLISLVSLNPHLARSSRSLQSIGSRFPLVSLNRVIMCSFPRHGARSLSDCATAQLDHNHNHSHQQFACLSAVGRSMICQSLQDRNILARWAQRETPGWLWLKQANDAQFK